MYLHNSLLIVCIYLLNALQLLILNLYLNRCTYFCNERWSHSSILLFISFHLWCGCSILLIYIITLLFYTLVQSPVFFAHTCVYMSDSLNFLSILIHFLLIEIFLYNVYTHTILCTIITFLLYVQALFGILLKLYFVVVHCNVITSLWHYRTVCTTLFKNTHSSLMYLFLNCSMRY